METDIPAVYSHLDDEDEYAKELEEFLETKAGVKGVVDSGSSKIPRIFIHPTETQPKSSLNTTACLLQVPVIDFGWLRNGKRMEVVKEVREAASTWGVFQIVNHGVPVATMDELLKTAREFHEQPQEVKEEWYSDDATRKVRLYSYAYDTASKAAYWKDTLIFLEAQCLGKQQFPPVCREAVNEYIKFVMQLKETIAELLSEALGLSSDYLAKTETLDSVILACHYYPACPQPELTWGIAKHTDLNFLTLLLQDDVGGLQVLHQGKWVDVPPIPGAIFLNLGDLMQLMTNDKFKTVEHRAGVVKDNSRVSVASFFFPVHANLGKPVGPIKELVSENDPPKYRETSVQEFIAYQRSKGPNASAPLPHFRIKP